MVLRIVKHELMIYSRDSQSRVMLIFVILLITISTLLSLKGYVQSDQEYQENVRQARLNWEGQATKDPHDAAHDGTYIVKPIYPLALFDNGIKDYSGQVIHLGAHVRKQSDLNNSKDYSGLFRFGLLTPSFIFTYLIPLLLIFIGYRVLTEERERQTIRLLLTQNTTPIKFILGKWLCLLIIAFVIWSFFMIVILIGTKTVERNISSHFLDWFTIGVIYLSYIIFFINFIVIVSSQVKSSGTSLMMLLAIWIFIVLVVPKVSTNLAGSVYPFPTLQTFTDNINQDQANGLNGHNFWNEAAQDFQQKVLDQYGVKTVEDLPVAYGGLLLAEGEKYESEIYTKHFDLLQHQYEDQRSVYRLCGLLSPMLPLKFVSMAVSRTDYNFLWHLEDEAEKYRVTFNTALNMNIAENAKGVDHYKAGKELWGKIPSFQYQWQSSQNILRDHLIELGLIFIWPLLSFFVCLYCGRKIKVI